MTHNKRKLWIWIAVTAAIIIGITISSYNTSQQDIDASAIFENKTEEQIKMELLEIQNYKYLEKPVATVIQDDYQFDVFLVQEKELTNYYGFYVVGTNMAMDTVDDSDYFKTGPVDFQLYTSTSDDSMAGLLSDTRLSQISGTNIMTGYIDFIYTDGAYGYTLLFDSEYAEDVTGNTNLGLVDLTGKLGDTISISAKDFRANYDLKDGYSGDLDLAGYSEVNWGYVGKTFLIAAVTVSLISLVAYMTFEREGVNSFKYRKRK